MDLLRYIISAPNKASEYVWACGLKEAQALAEHHFGIKTSLTIKQTNKYEFAMRIGAADVRTYGDVFEDCLNNIKVYGFIGDHNLEKDLHDEFKRQQALALIKAKDDLHKLSRLQNENSCN